ncbi:hypothetical protein ACFPVX_02605 [Cohnella faecalis]|uniref:HNH endonuclease n=1 Tax=Cohnella faecalis TaxID=2315694 RepID=A0A398CX99_9BACL|nr:HNH endonuclease [Cohnella faecalis]RIE05208.1 HNH endonuclease [Cohnella faecalis]
MNFIKRLFNRKQISEERQINETINHNTHNGNQSIIARNITGSTIMQYYEGNRTSERIIDERISKELECLRRSRFYSDFDTARETLIFANSLLDGGLSSGSSVVRCHSLAWCSRLLSITEVDKAQELLNHAKALGSCPEINVAEAFITSKKGDKHAALTALASENSPLSRSAAIMIVVQHDGALGAIVWFEHAGYTILDLNSDGKYHLMTLYLQTSQWEKIESCLDKITVDDQNNSPALNQILGICHLVGAIPAEFRTSVLNQVPFHAARFPLAADSKALTGRRIACQYFITATNIAHDLKCHRSEALFSEYALWLQLMDPSEAANGREKLEVRLREPFSRLRIIHLGIQFGIKLDLEMVEREIERHIILHGGLTHDTAVARFALAFTKNNPEDVANYIMRHLKELSQHIDGKYMQILQIEMLAEASLPDRAKESFERLLEEGLTQAEENRLRRVISEIEGINPIEALKEQFKKTDSIVDLQLLIDQLEKLGSYEELSMYSELLYTRTSALSDAERLATTLHKLKKSEKVVELIAANRELLSQSKILHMLFCWSLYSEGSLIEARSEMQNCDEEYDDPNYRLLRVSLGITVGDWNSLAAFVAKEYQKKEKRTAKELISAAQLAHNLGSPEAKELTFSAVEKGSDDADILVKAYFLATKAGWEDDENVANWLNSASGLSDINGPIQSYSLKEMVDMKPNWDRRESEVLQLYGRGDIPMFFAADFLNKTLVQTMLIPAHINLVERDPRRIVSIPAYSGNRRQRILQLDGTIAFDVSALLTLNFLSLLDKVFDLFDTIYLPHSTLQWLFEEKQKISFHQPSRVTAARQIQHMLATGVIEKHIPKTSPDSELAVQIGDELALFITEAKLDNDNSYVVRPYPVHRISSLMEEEADLTKYDHVLSSCNAIVQILRRMGQITAEEERKATNYLKFHEKPWPNQPQIKMGAKLYLDDLALTYFHQIGILEKLRAAGFKLFVSSRELIEANNLVSYSNISDKIITAIESIRSVVNSRIESGKIKICRISLDENNVISEHPTAEIFNLATSCHSIIIDDRFFNKNEYVANGIQQMTIYSTLDILDTLVSINLITDEERMEHRTLLRRAGYFSIPVTDLELSNHLKASSVLGDKVLESAELKAIRENILQVRMRTWLQLPSESLWLDDFLSVFTTVLKEVWCTEEELPNIRARSNWIINQIDLLGWAHTLESEPAENLIKTGRGEFIFKLLVPPLGASKELKIEYWDWVEEVVLIPIKDNFPDLFLWLLDRYSELIATISNMYAQGGLLDD